MLNLHELNTEKDSDMIKKCEERHELHLQKQLSEYGLTLDFENIRPFGITRKIKK